MSLAKHGVASHLGLVRKQNEDSISASPALELYLVADGMGGQAGGDVASRIAVETIERCVSNGDPLSEAIVQADNAIVTAAATGKGRPNMGTTIVALQIEGDLYRIAWVGDSRAYLINRGIQRLSRDHSLVQELLDRGTINENEARRHPRRNVITRALGSIHGDRDRVDEGMGNIQVGDIFLLCTDGLYGLVSDTDIEQAVRGHEESQVAADMLIQLALDAGGTDNISVIVVRAG